MQTFIHPYQKTFIIMANISIEKETPGEIIYVSHFEGQPVHFMQDKRTGEITVNADDVVRAIGEADSFEAFLGSDKGLDFIADWKKEHPNEPFFGGAVIKKHQ